MRFRIQLKALSQYIKRESSSYPPQKHLENDESQERTKLFQVQQQQIIHIHV